MILICRTHDGTLHLSEVWDVTYVEGESSITLLLAGEDQPGIYRVGARERYQSVLVKNESGEVLLGLEA